MATGGNTVRLTDRADTYTTQDGDEYVYALGGDDKITFGGFYWPDDEEYGHLQVHGGSGNDCILGGDGNSGQDLYGEDGNDYLEVGHGDGESLARGGRGNDVLRSLGGGGEGNYLYGDQGNDTLYAAEDGSFGVLNGGIGKDLLVGGAEDDRFQFFTNHTVAGSNRDVIKNYDTADLIDLGGMDANKSAAGDQGFTFVGATRDPGKAELGYYVKNGDTIIVGDDGAKTFEIELDRYKGPVDGSDFVL
jgi:Ca2+-binding RTX toxin-like protein